jgi:hypothetical protein
MRLAPGLVVQADLFEISDIGEDVIIVGLVGGVERGGLGGLGAGHVGRGTRNGRGLGIGMALGGNHIIIVWQRC